MRFNYLEDLIDYYKRYSKQCEFGVKKQKSEKGEDETIRYVTNSCTHSDKAKNRT